jgi:hypothetical protein
MDHIGQLSLLERYFGFSQLCSMKWILPAFLAALVVTGFLAGTALAKDDAAPGKTNVLFSPTVKIDAPKQLVANHATSAVAPDGSLQYDFTAGSKTAYVKFRPVKNGIWNLRLFPDSNKS